MLEIFGIITNVATIAAVVWGVVQYRDNKKRENKIATIEAYSRLQNEVFDNLNRWSPSDVKSAADDPRSDDYKELSGYLARIECFCAGINQKIYDFDAFYTVAHGYFDGDRGMLKQRLLPLLNKKLELADEDYYQNLHKVWNLMEKKTARQ